MPITIEALQARIAQLEREKQTALNDYQACHGAIQDCEHWIALLRAETAEPTA